MSFKITVLEKLNEEQHLAQIDINDFSEKIYLRTDYWTVENYREQWKDAIKRLNNDNKACLITEMYNPEHPAFAMMTWPLYREGDNVYIRQVYIPYDQIDKPFTVENAYKEIDDRETSKESNAGPSEWQVKLDNLKDWADKL